MTDEPDRALTVADLNAVKSEVDAALKRLENRLETRIIEDGKTSRRHMDVIAERIESHVKLVAEVNSHHSKILDDHEARLQKIERR